MAHREEDEWQDQIVKEMRRLAGEMSGAGMKPARSKGWVPNVDVLETDHHVVIKVDLAGVPPEKVALHYSAPKHTLTIKGVRRDESLFPGQRHRAHQLEIDYGGFWRELQLPEVPLKVEDVVASSVAGMLMLGFPKTEEKRNTVTIKKVITIRSI